MQYFSAEYTHTSTPLLDSAGDCWPRIHRWAQDARAAKRGSVRFKADLHQEQLEMRSADSICWNPYMNSDHNRLQIVTSAFTSSEKRMLLLDPEMGGTWYLGDRCVRQLRGNIIIPHQVPDVMSRIPHERYLTLCMGGWEDATQHYHLCTQADFDEYWTTNSGGAILPALFRSVNRDGVGFYALDRPDIRLPEPPSSSYQPHEYQTQPSRHSTSSARPELFSYIAEVGAAGGHTVSIPVDRAPTIHCPSTSSLSASQWRELYIDSATANASMRECMLRTTRDLAAEIDRLQAGHVGTSSQGGLGSGDDFMDEMIWQRRR